MKSPTASCSSERRCPETPDVGFLRICASLRETWTVSDTRCLAIATEKDISSDAVFDFALLVQDEWSDDDIRIAEEVQRETGLWTDVHEFRVDDEEYPTH